MTTTIALAGKGGVGKTSIAALVIKYLCNKQKGAVLAIDADPSSNLNMVLGLELDWTIGDIRENILEEVKSSLSATGAAMGTLPGGITKREFLDYKIKSSVSEGDQFDLIAMGRSEGPGCYCAVNHNLRDIVDTISRNYRYVVIDNEAGMEHLSRRTTRDVQHLLIISDPSQRGIVAAERIADFRKEFEINIENTYLIMNRVSGELPPPLIQLIEKIDFPFLGTIPEDAELREMEYNGKPLIDISNQSLVYQKLSMVLDQIFNNK